MGNWKVWAYAAAIRAIKTFAQATLAILSLSGTGVLDVDWQAALSAGALAAVLSVLTSLTGLPEVPKEDETAGQGPTLRM